MPEGRQPNNTQPSESVSGTIFSRLSLPQNGHWHRGNDYTHRPRKTSLPTKHRAQNLQVLNHMLITKEPISMPLKTRAKSGRESSEMRVNFCLAPEEQMQPKLTVMEENSTSQKAAGTKPWSIKAVPLVML